MNKTTSIVRDAAWVVCLIGLQGLPLHAVASGPVTGVQLQVTSAKPNGPPSEIPSYKNYTYYGDRYRDPFIPLNGDIRSDQSAYDRPPQITALMLKGIVQDAKGRMALLTSGVNSYVLKGGRLYDGRNRIVKKIAGVIKTESVVLIGADRTVREIRSKSPL
jgi:hypothetical protein